MSSHKKNNKQRQEKSQKEQAQAQQQVEALRATLLALDDEQLQRVVAHVGTFRQADEQMRKLLGFQVRAIPTDTLYNTDSELKAAEPDVPFTFVAPASDAVRARFASQPAHQLLPVFRAMSNKVPMIKGAAWHQRLQVELPALANTPVTLTPPPVVNPAFDGGMLATALQQTVQAHKDMVVQALDETVIDTFRTLTKFQIDQRGQLYNTRTPFILEDYATVGDFLEEWDGNSGQFEQVSWRVHRTTLDMLINFLPQTLVWLERENPAYYAELLTYVAYYGSGLVVHGGEDKATVAQEIFHTDIIGDMIVACESEAYAWITDRQLADLLRDSDLPITQSRTRMAAQPEMQALLHQFEEYCYSTAIVTLTTQDDPQPLTLDIHREGDTVTYGYAPEHKDLLMAKLLGGAGGLILRSFLEEFAPQSKVPIKELRGWALNSADSQLVAQRIPADDLYWAMNTDNQTGKRLNAEPDVRYC